MALGLMITINALGTVVGTPTFGYIVDATGSYVIAWQALAGVLVLGTVNIAVFVSEAGGKRCGGLPRPVRQAPGGRLMGRRCYFMAIPDLIRDPAAGLIRAHFISLP